MAGDSRIQGAGPRLSLLDGDLAAVLQQLRFRGSSIRPAVFVSPGPTAGTAIVTNECSPETPYQVTSERNFRPGTPVLLGSYAGSGEETIISRAPADKAGAAGNPVRLSRGTIRRPRPASASACPQPLTGKTYLAIFRDTGASVIKAWLYADGVFSSVLGTFDYSAEPWSITEGQEYFRIASPERVVFNVRMDDGWDGIATWNPAAETVAVLDTELSTPDDVISSPIISGGFVYFTHMGGDGLQLYKVLVGASGILDAPGSALGLPLDPATGGALYAPGANLSHSGGENFQVASFEFEELGGSIVAIPYFTGGAWSGGIGRATLAGEDPGYGSNGRAVLASHSLRATFLPSTQHAIGLMPAGPGSPEVSMLHPEWALTLGPPSISPSGSEVALYPASDGEVTGILRLAVALPPPSYAASCPPPLIAVEDGPDGTPEAMLCRD